MPETPQEEARAALSAAGQLPDAEIDLAAVAIQFARIDAPDADWRAAAAQLSAVAKEAVSAALADQAADEGDADRRRAVLAAVLHGGLGFKGDARTYDDLANANLIRVIERRQGLPVALGILWLHAAEAAGWGAHGVDFPGHFLVAVEAELRPGLLRPMTRRAVLLRLQNNIKLRRLRAGAIEAALSCTEDMLRLCPDHAVLWREAGLMNRRLDRIGAALQCLDRSLELEPEGEAAERTRTVADELRHRLN
jgi:regulator of sirC expression with transglutaminase-like and TPR domain